jgi:hypothetical protein
MVGIGQLLKCRLLGRARILRCRPKVGAGTATRPLDRGDCLWQPPVSLAVPGSGHSVGFWQTADEPGVAVAIADTHIADASRRWAITLDDGTLVFVNSTDLGGLSDII